jgi:hypothetical protein
MLFDAFICHASEDKGSFVRPLAEHLVEHNIEVWYDEFSLNVGDSLRRSLDRGLCQSRFGIVVLSPSFFAKHWSQWELDGLVSRQNSGEETVILPVWHGVSRIRGEVRYAPWPEYGQVNGRTASPSHHRNGITPDRLRGSP